MPHPARSSPSRALVVAAAIEGMPTPLGAQEVGQVPIDWMGSDLVVEALPDPGVLGVTCHLAYFERGLLERLSRGAWFRHSANTAIACRQTGPITLGNLDDDAEEIFAQSRSPGLEALRVWRLYDAENQTLIYVAHAREPGKDPAGVVISTIALQGEAAAR